MWRVEYQTPWGSWSMKWAGHSEQAALRAQTGIESYAAYKGRTRIVRVPAVSTVEGE